MNRFHYCVIALAVAIAVMLPAHIVGQGASTATKGQGASTPNKGLGAAATHAATVKPTGKAWTKKTPDGQPDIQGYWTNTTYTPLARAANVNKEFYTPEEYDKLVASRVDNEEGRADQNAPGTNADVHYDFNQFALQNHQSLRPEDLRTARIVDPKDGRIPPLTAEGNKKQQERAAAQRVPGGQYDSVQNVAVGTRCIIQGAGPPMEPQGYNSNYQIVQSPGYVMIIVEMITDVRIIPLDGRAAPPSQVQQYMGDSRGHWEGDTLVVETSNFNFRGGSQNLRGVRDNFKLIERFKRTDENTLSYEYTVNDPNYTKPWTVSFPFAKTNGPLFEMACHEGNYGLRNILSGARADEKKAAAGQR
jgi:hypothetical protein